ncbi:methyltransferase domain-containing protein [Stieleria varia]|uniref:Mg-protoporphyrin IX methyl transferase n=1 Tax=Stieleria varia TaxID=2528005 RepID=A0A5C6BAP3_9BACT|nr:hypothetical protein [Stieleria varia]TWU08336.1 Mg-protoporphyrin IX methyl transferase [Stieleria varia]
MPLSPIPIPDSITQLPIPGQTEQLIDTAYERIEAFMLSDQEVIENFVNCDFHLIAQSIEWIFENHLLAGNRFCEWGCGFGVAAMLAAARGMESVGIEIESVLVEQCEDLAELVDNAAEFYCGSFVPRDVPGLTDLAAEMKHVDVQEGDIYDEIGLSINDFDLFFAFPWPGEHEFFEAIFEACAADGALLLTYRGREGTHLLRKVG